MSEHELKETKDIAGDVMRKIREGELKMRPKLYFVLGSVLAFLGVVLSVATSVFLFGLISFSMRGRGMMAGHRLERLISDFPWWIAALAVLATVFGIILLRRYDFSYKINFKVAAALVITSVIASGWLIDALGFNDLLYRRGPMRGMMHRYFEEQSFLPSSKLSPPSNERLWRR